MKFLKIFQVLSLAIALIIFCSGIAKADCSSNNTVSITTEFQGKVTGLEQFKQAKDVLGLIDSDLKKIEYQIFDLGDLFQKNNIVIRYRDKGKKVDFAFKVKFLYDSEIIKMISNCFIGQKIEVNRYSNQADAFELVFRKEIKKENLNISTAQKLSNDQILNQFKELQVEVKKQLEMFNFELAQNFQGNKKINEVMNKLHTIVDSEILNLKVTRNFEKNKWTLPWGSYSDVFVEVTNSQTPLTEISVLYDGDVKSGFFFNDLKSLGLKI